MRLRDLFNKKRGFEGRFARLEHSIYRRLQGPEMVEWFPSFRCNSRCRYCGGYDAAAIATFEQVIPEVRMRKLIRASAAGGTKVWNIGGRGGEPFLYPGLAGLLEEIKANGMQGILITNGLLLDDELVRRLCAMQWDILRVSLDSCRAEVNDGQRGIPGAFEKVDKALELFRLIKAESRLRNPHIICCPVLTSATYRDILPYIRYCKSRGVDEIQFMPLINVHERAASLALSEEQKKELGQLLLQAENETGIRHNCAFMRSLCVEPESPPENASGHPKSKGLYCVHLWKTLVLSEDGYLSPCSLIKDKLLKVESLESAWRSPQLEALRRKVLSGERIDQACEQCCGPLRNETADFNRFLAERQG